MKGKLIIEVNDHDPANEGQPVNVDFECEKCKGIITLGIVGGLEALNGDLPPSCLYCGNPKPLQPVKKDEAK